MGALMQQVAGRKAGILCMVKKACCRISFNDGLEVRRQRRCQLKDSNQMQMPVDTPETIQNMLTDYANSG